MTLLTEAGDPAPGRLCRRARRAGLAARRRGAVRRRGPRGRRFRRHRRLRDDARPLRGARTRRGAAARAAASALGPFADILANTPPEARDPKKPWLLAPIDLQAIKAAGVTFAASMLERVIEERARGDRAAAEKLRGELAAADRRRSREAEAGLARGRKAEGGADRRGRVVAISRSRHRPGRRNLHQGAADVGGRDVCRGRLPFEVAAGTTRSPRRCSSSARAARSSARRSAMTSTCAISKAAARCCSARRRTRTRAAAVGPFLRLFDETFSLDDVRRDGHLARGRRRGRLYARGRLLDGRDQPRSRRTRAPAHRPEPRLSRRRGALSAARCSRRSPTATRPARASPTSPATSSPSAPTSSAGLSTACATRTNARAGLSARRR